MTPFATAEDYEARYGDVEDEKRLEALLADASLFLASQRGLVIDPDDGTQAALLTAVTCAMAHRSMMAGSYAGLSSVSQGAGGYTASVSVYNPSGDFYLTKGEKQALGISGARIGSVAPAIDGWYGSNAGDAP